MNLTEIAIIIHSTQESEYIKGCKETLDRFGLHCEVKVFTPLLDPPELQEFMQKAPERGIKIFIATSSLQSKLAAMIAAYTHLPVIAIPIGKEGFADREATIASVEMPEGVPVAVVSSYPTGGKNAAILAAQFLAFSDNHLMDRLKLFKQNGCRFV